MLDFDSLNGFIGFGNYKIETKMFAQGNDFTIPHAAVPR